MLATLFLSLSIAGATDSFVNVPAPVLESAPAASRWEGAPRQFLAGLGGGLAGGAVMAAVGAGFGAAFGAVDFTGDSSKVELFSHSLGDMGLGAVVGGALGIAAGTSVLVQSTASKTWASPDESPHWGTALGGLAIGVVVGAVFDDSYPTLIGFGLLGASVGTVVADRREAVRISPSRLSFWEPRPGTPGLRFGWTF